MSDYFLHQRGYRYTWPPVIGGLMPQEEAKLWRGHKVYKEEIEGGGEEQTPGKTATAGDKRAFANYSAEVNGDG